MKALIRMMLAFLFCALLSFNCHAQNIIVDFAPSSFALDGAGGLYISDNDTKVYRVSANGGLSAVAGNGTRGFSGDGGKATSAQLSSAQLSRTGGLAVDSAGNLYIADDLNYRIRKVTPAGVITTVAGNGTKGYSGDGGKATSAQLSRTSGLAVDAAGSIYIANAYRIRKIAPDGVITTVAGNGERGFSGDGGKATSAQLSRIGGLAVDAAGNLYIADAGNFRIRKVTPDGMITTVAGNGSDGFSGDGGKAASAQLSEPVGLAVDAAGSLYIADSGNFRIRKVTPEGTISTVAGNWERGLCFDHGRLASARDPGGGPKGLAVDAAGNLYFLCQLPEARIRKLTPEGVITSIVTRFYKMGGMGM
jgi:trimeric autotransporter adhesin